MHTQSFCVQPPADAPLQYPFNCANSSRQIMPNQMPFDSKPSVEDNIGETKAKQTNSCSAGLMMYNKSNEPNIYSQIETGLTPYQIQNGLLETIADHPDPPASNNYIHLQHQNTAVTLNNSVMSNLDKSNINNHYSFTKSSSAISKTPASIQPSYSRSQTSCSMKAIPSPTIRMRNSSSLDLNKNELAFSITENNNKETKKSSSIFQVNNQLIRNNLSASKADQPVSFQGQLKRSNCKIFETV